MKKTILIICLVLLLVAIDQGAKLYINNNFSAGDKELSQVKDTIHIHHLINYRIHDEWSEREEATGINVSFWKWFDVLMSAFVSSFLLLFIYSVYRLAVICGMRSYKILACSVFVFISSSTICGIIDRVFWECTHDFICISKSFVSDLGQHKISHASADIKDYYIYAAVVLFIIFSVLFLVEFLKLPNKKEAFSAYFQNIKQKCKRNKSE